MFRKSLAIKLQPLVRSFRRALHSPLLPPPHTHTPPVHCDTPTSASHSQPQSITTDLSALRRHSRQLPAPAMVVTLSGVRRSGQSPLRRQASIAVMSILYCEPNSASLSFRCGEAGAGLTWRAYERRLRLVPVPASECIPRIHSFSLCGC